MLDEVSFLQDFDFARADKQLREITGQDLPFGGLFFIFLGDFKQLPPPGDSRHALYHCMDNTHNAKSLPQRALTQAGRDLWRSIDCVSIMDQTFRQAPHSPYANMLTHIRNNEATIEDVDLLNKRKMTLEQIRASDSFSSALHAFSTHAQVWNHLIQRMQHRQQPIANIWAQITLSTTKLKQNRARSARPTEAELRSAYRKASIDTSKNSRSLFPLLQLQLGMPVMIRGTYIHHIHTYMSPFYSSSHL